MGREGQPIITKKTCIVICRFLVGFIGSQIYFGLEALGGNASGITYAIVSGIMYIFYPFSGLCLFVFFIASGNKKLIDDAILFLGVLGIIYIVIPLVVSVIFDKMKKMNDGDKRLHVR